MDKESFVGPKQVLLYLKSNPFPVGFVFSSSFTLAKAVKMAKGQIDETMFSKWDGLERFTYHSGDVMAFIFPKDALNRKSSKIFFDFAITFSDGTRFRIPIAGENRLRIVYKQLEELVGKPVPDGNMWIVVTQEQNKIAHIRYASPVSFISSTKIEEPEGEN